MRKTHRILATLCVGVMILGMLTACGTSKKDTSTSTNTKAEATTGTEATATTSAETVASEEKTDVAGSYTYIIASDKLAGKTAHNGFISAIGVVGVNALTLNEDGTYVYKKQVANFDEKGAIKEGGVNIEYTFTGSYTADGKKVTLESPEDCEFSEDWGDLSTQGYLASTSGTASKGDMVVPKDDEKYDPLNCFETEYYTYSDNHESPVVVTVDPSGSYTYNAVASSDDE